MTILGLLMLIVSIITLLYAFYKIKNQKQIDKETEEINKKLLNSYNDLLIRENCLIEKITLLEQQEQNQTDKIKELNKLTEDMNKNAAAAFEQYVDTLEDSYLQKEKEFENSVGILDLSYASLQDSYINKINEVKSDLHKISSTRAAAMEAKLREEKIKQQKEFYQLSISIADLNDAITLRKIESQLNNPRVLRMLIWQTFYQKPMNNLCSNILGTNTVTGIYKITNQLNDSCYIGQAVDIAKRWKEHAKCGLGIDAPVSNKLYTAMQKDGLENFSWEVLEKCSSNELNEKEKFYIELYQSKEYGYNNIGGINK